MPELLPEICSDYENMLGRNQDLHNVRNKLENKNVNKFQLTGVPPQPHFVRV